VGNHEYCKNAQNRFEDVGVPGQSFLRDALTSCTDPLKAIEEFQVISMHRTI
jgi:hypothetical protein